VKKRTQATSGRRVPKTAYAARYPAGPWRWKKAPRGGPIQVVRIQGSEMVEVMRPRLARVVVSVSPTRCQRSLARSLAPAPKDEKGRTGDNDLLRKLDALPSERREGARGEIHARVGRRRRDDVPERVERRREADALGPAEDVEDLGHRRLADGVADLRRGRRKSESVTARARESERETAAGRTDMTMTTELSIECSPRRLKK